MAVIEQDAITVGPVPTQPILDMSQSAAERLLKMMQEKELADHALRVFVAGGGCSGLQYGMTFDTSFGLPVMIDPVSYRYLKGASIDYVDSLMGGGFKIENPNAVSSCGCGTSFRPNEDAGDDEDDYDAPSSGGGCGSGCGCGH
jgi:iron-sulfur cluster assembly accessory protein